MPLWVAEDWRDYTLLDCSGGERLERWGPYTLIRPDPQVIWNTPRKPGLWEAADARYARSASGGGAWGAHTLPARWPVRYGDLTFQVGPMNFKHTGLFPEQAPNWFFIRESCEPDMRVLNLFAYTGAATLAAASAGARVCHVDASKGMVQWAKQNAALSGLADKPIRWIVDDCAAFVRRELRRGHVYDALILDPPSYGRGPGGETWRLEDSLFGLLELCVGVLSPAARFVLLNTYTTGLAPGTLTYLLTSVFAARLGGTAQAEELGLPVQNGGVLPCGASGRWTAAVNNRRV